MDPVELKAALRFAGILQTSLLPSQESAVFRKRWRATFCPHADWRRGRSEVDAIGAQAGVSARRVAIRDFSNARLHAQAFYVTETFEPSGILEVQGLPPEYEWWSRFARNRDMIITDADWSWTLAVHHEMNAMSIGPFFARCEAPPD